VSAHDERRRQVITAVAILGGVAGLYCAFAFGAHLPGVAGEFFARVLGFATTPFILEGSLFILGFVIVLTLNQWRQIREGDELVYLEQVTEGATGLPDQARWAVYPEKPLDPTQVSRTDLLEGALAIGDHPQALTLLENMSDAERGEPAVLRMRISLAEATGKTELARELRAKLDPAG
jgi:hypothetical protein